MWPSTRNVTPCLAPPPHFSYDLRRQCHLSTSPFFVSHQQPDAGRRSRPIVSSSSCITPDRDPPSLQATALPGKLLRSAQTHHRHTSEPCHGPPPPLPPHRLYWLPTRTYICSSRGDSGNDDSFCLRKRLSNCFDRRCRHTHTTECLALRLNLRLELLALRRYRFLRPKHP